MSDVWTPAAVLFTGVGNLGDWGCLQVGSSGYPYERPGPGFPF